MSDADIPAVSNADMVTAVVNSWGPLAKQRPNQTAFIVSALASWTPRALAGLPASFVRSVEKSVRILMVHLSRCVCIPLNRGVLTMFKPISGVNKASHISLS
jgi:hypothetical protein